MTPHSQFECFVVTSIISSNFSSGVQRATYHPPCDIMGDLENPGITRATSELMGDLEKAKIQAAIEGLRNTEGLSLGDKRDRCLSAYEYNAQLLEFRLQNRDAFNKLTKHLRPKLEARHIPAFMHPPPDLVRAIFNQYYLQYAFHVNKTLRDD